MKKVRTGAELGSVLKGLREMTGDEFGVILSKLSMDGMKALIRRTAVDTGYARSKWQVAVDAKPSEGAHKGTRGESHRKPALVEVKASAGSHVILYNNTEYIIHLEYGTSRMKAQPMVEPTRIQLEAIAEKLSKELSRKKYDV